MHKVEQRLSKTTQIRQFKRRHQRIVEEVYPKRIQTFPFRCDNAVLGGYFGSRLIKKYPGRERLLLYTNSMILMHLLVIF
jgi:hypothetical protein